MDLSLLARVLSGTLAPPVVLTAASVVVAVHAAGATTEGALLAAISSFFISLVPTALIVFFVRRAQSRDYMMGSRKLRMSPFLISLLSATVGLLVLILLRAPGAVTAFVATMVVGLACASAITLFWKISLHTAVLASVSGVLVQLLGPPLLVLLPVIAALGWARTTLRSHTLAEVVAGVILGLCVSALVFSPFQ